MSIKKILYFKYVSIVFLYSRYSFALFLNICYIIAHVEIGNVFVGTIFNNIIGTRCYFTLTSLSKTQVKALPLDVWSTLASGLIILIIIIIFN